DRVADLPRGADEGRFDLRGSFPGPAAVMRAECDQVHVDVAQAGQVDEVAFRVVAIVQAAEGDHFVRALGDPGNPDGVRRGPARWILEYADRFGPSLAVVSRAG